jgi:predicted RecA/RadA family phage recombinase
MRNYIHGPDRITITAGGTIASGAGVLFGDLFGVALHGATSGQSLTLQLMGRVRLNKATGTINPGVLVYWDNTNARVTTTASGNRPIGFHAGAAANTGAQDTAIEVMLTPAPLTTPA